MPMRSSRRAGFTLIELLVVISIIALLSAITAAAVSRVRAAQQAKNTEMTVLKLQEALDQQWKAVVDNCQQDARLGKIPIAVVTLCGGDMDRALALWTYANLKREFPQSINEARNWSFVINGQVLLRPRATFNNISGSGTPTDEAAALLYLILIEKANGGASSMSDEVTNSAQTQVTIGSARYPVFKDVYGSPITFIRWYEHAELNQAPFVNLKAASKDSLDPRGKLAGAWPTPGNQALALASLNSIPPAVQFDSQNKMITVIAFGPNLNFENSPLGTTDDFWGYRLRRLGKQGD